MLYDVRNQFDGTILLCIHTTLTSLCTKSDLACYVTSDRTMLGTETSTMLPISVPQRIAFVSFPL